jgi:predicted permease
LVAVLTLALGIGANTAVFTLVHALVLRSLPVERPGELYRLGDTNSCCVNSGLQTSYSLFSYPLFEHLKANAPEFQELAGFQATTMPLGIRRPGELTPQPMPGQYVTGNYFAMFGVKAAAGRMLETNDDRPGAAPVAVLSHRAWTQFYGQAPSLIGETVSVNGKPITIVGVSAPQFFGDTIRPDPAALWIPFALEPMVTGAGGSLLERADTNWLYAIGRVTGGATASQISGRLTTSLQQWLAAQPFVTEPERPRIPQQRIAVVPAPGGVASAKQQYGRSLNLLFAAAAMVLLIGAANLANLLLARADRGQAAIRAALGASAGRLVRQALTDGVILALLGGLIGIALGAVSAGAVIRTVFPAARFVPVDAAPSGWVWAFALALAVFTGALFTAAPAWAMSRTPPLDALSGVGRGSQARSFVPRGSLVIVQVALSLVLLSSAGLLATSLSNLEQQPLGFTPANRLVVFISPTTSAGDVPGLTSLYSQFDERLRQVPGIERVAFSMYSPMEGNNWSSGISIGGRKPDPERPTFSSWNRVTPGYFETIGTRIIRGRGIEERDTPASKRVAVVNDALVRRYFEHQDPIGQTLGIGDPGHASDFEIVGVVEDVKYTGAAATDVRSMFFIPSFQQAPYTSPGMKMMQARSMLLRTIVVQVSPTSRNVEAGIRQALAAVDPNLNVMRIIPLPTQVNVNFRLERVMARLTSVYGLLALALASLGLYGVTAYGVSQRTREIGVRMALGADRWRIVRTCIRGPLVQTCAGLAIGLLGAFFAGRALSAQLFGVGGLDPTVFVGATLALVVSATLAAALPARRAASVNPAMALRGE